MSAIQPDLTQISPQGLMIIKGSDSPTRGRGIQTTAAPPAVPALSDARRLQEDLRPPAADVVRTLDSMAFGPTGEVDFWSRQAKQMAFLGAAWATGASLSVASQHADPPAAERSSLDAIRSGDAAFSRRACDLAQGYGDIDFWSRRTKQLALQTAIHACTVASLCDASMAGQIAARVDATLKRAQRTAYDGFGDGGYWSARAKDLAAAVSAQGYANAIQLPSPAAQPPASQAGAALSQPPASRTAPIDAFVQQQTAFASSLDDLTFSYHGDVSDWSKRAKLVAFRVSAQAAHNALWTASQVPDAPAARSARLDAMDQLTRRFAERAEEVAFHGFGDQAYWSHRSKHFALEAAQYVADLARHCDASLLASVRPALERALADAESAAFSGYGDISYWSARTKQLATDMTLVLEDARISARADAAASERVQSLAPSTTEETRAAEADKARQQIVAEQWAQFLDSRNKDIAPVQVRVNALAQQINPLVEEDRKAVKVLNIAAKAILPSLFTTAIGQAIGQGLGIVGPIVTGVGLIALVASFGTNSVFRGRHQGILARYEPLNSEYESLDRKKQEYNRAAQEAARRVASAEDALRRSQGQLDVHRMAESGAPAQGVTVSEDVVVIGKLKLPRRSDEARVTCE